MNFNKKLILSLILFSSLLFMSVPLNSSSMENIQLNGFSQSRAHFTVNTVPVINSHSRSTWISLISPSNNAVIIAGTTMTLRISDRDGVKSAHYNWNGAANTSLPIEEDNIYSIIGPSLDGPQTLNVFASDIIGGRGNAVFTFTVDSTNPVVLLNSPANNTSVKIGTVVDFGVTDDNPVTVNIRMNDGASTELISPFDYTLDTLGSIKLEITAKDGANNAATLLLKYNVIVDKSPTTSTPTTTTSLTTPDKGDEGDDGFVSGFTTIYALIAIMFVIQIVKIKKSVK